MGSSPLARGLHQLVRHRPVRPGIIPARAGFTWVAPCGVARRPDHPRSRGVYAEAAAKLVLPAGSSPLARGLLRKKEFPFKTVGIIPARAGFTVDLDLDLDKNGDHPRSRGVYELALAQRGEDDGSSPLARGLQSSPPLQPRRNGIIPARAGFTAPSRPAVSGQSDHPRSRGVYAWELLKKTNVEGSSPLARGLHRLTGNRVSGRRIIPARAGFTADDHSPLTCIRDHPRSRGVYRLAMSAATARPGSSPLARGLLPVRDVGRVDAGIIPARAGFTTPQPAPAGQASDHPRSRGVYLDHPSKNLGRQGSSPLARGLPAA